MSSILATIYSFFTSSTESINPAEDLTQAAKDLHTRIRSLFKESVPENQTPYQKDYLTLANRLKNLQKEDPNNTNLGPIEIYLTSIHALLHPQEKKPPQPTVLCAIKGASDERVNKTQLHTLQLPDVITSDEVTEISEPPSKRARIESIEPHGIKSNGSNCYAIAAYQLLANCTSILGCLPPELASLKNYNTCNSGDQILEAINQDRMRFPPRAQHCAGEVYSYLISLLPTNNPCYTPTKITTSHTYELNQKGLKKWKLKETKIRKMKEAFTWDDKCQKIEHEPAFYLGLNIVTEEPIINFENALQRTINETINESITNSETGFTYTKEKRDTRFTQSPKQLFIQIERLFIKETGTATFNTKPLESVPLILDPQALGLLDDGVISTPLKLKGFIAHQGGVTEGSSFGHYTSYFKKPSEQNPAESIWYCADNDLISIISESEALNVAKLHGSDFYYNTN